MALTNTEQQHVFNGLSVNNTVSLQYEKQTGHTTTAAATKLKPNQPQNCFHRHISKHTHECTKTSDERQMLDSNLFYTILVSSIYHNRTQD